MKKPPSTGGFFLGPVRNMKKPQINFTPQFIEGSMCSHYQTLKDAEPHPLRTCHGSRGRFRAASA